MTLDEHDDELLRTLGQLRVLEPDGARRERVRARGHAVLQQRRMRAEWRRYLAARVLEPALVGGLSVSYLLAILFVLLRLHRAL